MLDHASIAVPELAAVLEFYDATLGALGYERQWIRDDRARYGDRTLGDGTFLSVVELAGAVAARGHLALRAIDAAAVDAFFAAAIQNGGSDDGTPGPRPAYHARYYGAFVCDPAGNRLEAVCHTATPAGAA